MARSRIVPPLLAIVLQFLSFPSESNIEREARDIQRRFEFSDSGVEVIREMTKGALTQANIAPTVVSAFWSIYVILSKVDSKYIVGFILVSILSIVSIFVLSICASKTLFQIAAFKVPRRSLFGGGYFNFTFSTAISGLMYTVNFALLALAILVFFGVIR